MVTRTSETHQYQFVVVGKRNPNDGVDKKAYNECGQGSQVTATGWVVLGWTSRKDLADKLYRDSVNTKWVVSSKFIPGGRGRWVYQYGETIWVDVTVLPVVEG